MSEEIKNEPILPAEEPAVKSDKKARTIMMWASIIIAVIVLGIIVYIFAYREPAIKKGNEAIGVVDRTAIFENNDSLALEGYKNVADNYGFAAGNRATLMTAQLLYKQGDYEQALKYLNKYKATDKVIAAQALTLKGDCLVNLDKYDDAIKAYDKAISRADKNPMLVPVILTKKATVLAEQGKYAKAADIYAEIENKYPEAARTFGAESKKLQYESLAQ